MRILYVLIIFLFLFTGISSAADFNKNEIEWDSGTSGTVYRGESFTSDQYTVKAVQFFGPVPGIKTLQGNIVPDPDVVVDPSVNLEIYKNGVFINETILKVSSGPYIDPDYEYRVSVIEFPKRSSNEWVYEYYKPWAKVGIEKRAKPELEVKIITDKSPYISYYDSMIHARVKIINKGGAFIKNIEANLNIGELNLTSYDTRLLHKSYLRIDRKAQESYDVSLHVPELTEDRTYVLSADARGYDVKGLEYTASNSSNVAVTVRTEHYFRLSKSARDRIYLGDNDTVRIVASNGGVYDIYNITIQDSIIEDFDLEPNTTLEWNIPLLKPGQNWETNYKIIPLRTNINGFKIPEAAAKITVNNRPYKVTSEEPGIIVNGPIIILNKTVDKEYAYINEDVIVTVSINNIGNIPTRVEVKDIIPEGVRLVSGETSLGVTFLELNEPIGFSYIIRSDAEREVQLLPARANFTDIVLRGEKRSEMLSNMPNITFLDTSKPKPTPSNRGSGEQSNNSTENASQNAGASSMASNAVKPTPITPGFGIIMAFIMLLFAAILKRR